MDNKSIIKVRVLLLLGIVLSILSFVLVGAIERRSLEESFESQVMVFEKVFSEQIHQSINHLHSLKAFFDNTEQISNEQFSGFSQKLLERSPFITALEWIPEVRASDREKYVSKLQSAGFEEFYFKEKDAEGKMIKAGVRPYYYPVYYVEPYERNKVAHGFDLGSHSGRLQAILYSQAKQTIACTEPIQLVQDEQKGAAVLVFLPIKKSGLVLAVLRISNLFQFTEKQLNNQNILFEVADVTGGGNKVILGLDHHIGVVHSESTQFSFGIDIGGRNWQVRAYPTANYPHTSYRWIVFGIMLFFSFIIYRHMNQELHQQKKITELVEIRTRELSVARQLAEQASHSKSEFLANMSHEIRTPMTAILGYIDLLKENEKLFQKEDQEAIGIIERNGLHLLEIINDILDLSKIEAHKMELESLQINLFKLIEDLVNLMKPRADAKGIFLIVDWAFPLPDVIMSDPLRLRQVLINLLGNAVKFTEKGGVTLKVSLDPQEDQLVINVCDSGVGMSQDQLEHVFDAFSQADSTTTRKFGGTGLGLAISHRLIKIMQGEILVNSEVNEGSSFKVILPVDFSQVKMLTQMPAIETEVATPKKSSVMGKVLLVDDNKTNLKLISKILTKMGLTVDCQENGQEALNYLEEKSVDLVLMDVQMPEMDGCTAAGILRRKGYKQPVIALTANNMKGDRENCLAAGYTDFTPKPVNRTELFEKLSHYLS